MNDNISGDLWREIFSWLPVRSLVRFRCVSKPWRSLIDDPSFCHLHLNRFENNRSQAHLFVAEEGEIWFGRRRRQSFLVKDSKAMETKVSLGAASLCCLHEIFILESPGEYDYRCHGNLEILSMIDGVILLQNNETSELLLWNPSIRKVRIIPPSPQICKGVKNVDLGLGFDPRAMDYNYIRVIRPRKRAKDEDSGYEELVTFHMSREVFAPTCRLPEDADEEDYSFQFSQELVMANGECLLVKYDSETGKGSIWVLEFSGTDFESSTRWSKRCSLDTGYPVFLYVLKNGDLLLRDEFDVIRYVVQTREHERIVSKGDVHIAHEYIESLILL